MISTFLAGCGLTGEEVGRIEIDQLSTAENIQPKYVEFELNKGDVLNYWTELDIEFDGNLLLEYQVELVLGEKSMGVISLNPFEKDITIGELKTSIMNKTKWRFSGRMANFDISESGNYKFNAILMSNGNESLRVNRAALVFKK